MQIASPMNPVFITSFFLILLTQTCNTGDSSTVEEANKLMVVSGQYNNWVAGNKGSGSGVEYYLTLVALDDAVGIDSIHIENETLKTISKPKGGKKFYDIGGINYSKGDTIILRASGGKTYQINEENVKDDKLHFFVGESNLSIPLQSLTKVKEAKRL